MHSSNGCRKVWPTFQFLSGSSQQQEQSIWTDTQQSDSGNKRETLCIFFFFFFPKWNVASIQFDQTEGIKYFFHPLLSLHAICHPDTNQKQRSAVMDDTLAVNLLGRVVWAHTGLMNTRFPLRHSWAVCSQARRPGPAHNSWCQSKVNQTSLITESSSSATQRSTGGTPAARCHETGRRTNSTGEQLTLPGWDRVHGGHLS